MYVRLGLKVKPYTKDKIGSLKKNLTGRGQICRLIECFHMTSRRPYNETAAMLVSQTSPLGVELFSYANAFFCSNKFT